MPAEADADPLVGVVLGDAYQLVGRIGQGGMGAVYEAHHLRVRKRVAVKLLNRAMASKDEALTRFRREAVVASRLGHPNLVNILDFGSSADGQPYLVMEFLEGEDLDRRIHRSGAMPLPSAIRISRQVAAAVSAVHAKGIVHRDLKPANIFLVHVPGEPDFVKVLDFGVSKIRASQTKLTDASKTVGTPAYMSPEQAFGPSHAVDHRADQWALACIIWEMLSGHPPFSADDPDALFYQLRNLSPEPLSAYVPDLPPALEPVLLRALSKQPTDRFPSIRDFVRNLEAAALGSGSENVLAVPAETPLTESIDKTIVARPRLDWADAIGWLGKARALGVFVRDWLKQVDTRMKVVIAAGATVGVAVVILILFAGGHRKVTGAGQMILPPTGQTSKAGLPPPNAVQVLPAPLRYAHVEAIDTDQAPPVPANNAKPARSEPAPESARPTSRRGTFTKHPIGKPRLRLTIDDF